MIKQISIYTENRKGALRTLVRTLADAGVALRAFVTNENGEFGTVRILTDNDSVASKTLSDAGYLTKLTSVLAVEVSDSAGGLADLLDVQAEIARLQKEEKRLQGELKRSAGMLSNEKFLAKAPAAKIEAEKEKQKQYEVQMEGVRKELEQLRSM